VVCFMYVPSFDGIVCVFSLKIFFVETAWCGSTTFVEDGCHQEEVGCVGFLSCFCVNGLVRNRASGAPNGATRKGTANLPKIASSSTRPRASTTGNIFTATRLSPTTRTGITGGTLAMKRQRRTSTGLSLPSTSSRRANDDSSL
jgi:hypothetical protein